MACDGQYQTQHSDLEAAVYSGCWAEVAELLERGVPDDSHRWVVSIAGECLEGGALANYILPHSHNDQLDELLPVVVRRGQWWVVGQLLKRGVGDEAQRTWAVQEAGKTAVGQELTAYIVPHCNIEQLEHVLTASVNRKQWEPVGQILDVGVSDERCRWAVEEAARHAEHDTCMADILRHARDDQLESVLREAVTRDLWRGVCELLKRDHVGDASRRWAVEEAAKRAGDSPLSSILPCCTDDQKPLAVSLAVERGLWPCVSRVLERGVDSSLQTWAVSTCSKQGTAQDLETHMLKHCVDTQVVAVLKTVVKRELWGAAAQILAKHPEITLSERKHTLTMVSKLASEETIISSVLPCCSCGDLDLLLPGLVKRGQWKAIIVCLKRGLVESQRTWISCEAVQQADGSSLCEILQQCSVEQFHQLFKLCVKKQREECVDMLLQWDITDTQREWAVGEVCRIGKEAMIRGVVARHCQNLDVSPLLKTVVKRKLWRGVEALVEKTADDQLRGWAVREACKSEDYIVSDHILTCCPASWVQSVVAVLIKRNLFYQIKSVMLCTDDPNLREHVLIEISKSAPEDSVIYFMRTQYPATGIDEVVRNAVNRCMWRTLRELLRQGYCSEDTRDWAVESVCKAMNTDTILYYIVPHCTDRIVEKVLRMVVKRCHWWAASSLLGRIHNDSLLEWTVKEASKFAVDHSMLDIVQYCPERAFTSVLSTLMKRDMWWSVKKMLKTDRCSDSLRGDIMIVKKAIKQFLKNPDERGRVHPIVFKCGHDHLDIAMSELMKRKDWQMVRQVVNLSNVDDHWHGRIGNQTDFMGSGQYDGTTFLHIVCLNGLLRTVPCVVQEGEDPLAVSSTWGSLLNFAVLSKEHTEHVLLECVKLGVSTHQPGITEKLGQGDHTLYTLTRILNGLLPRTADGDKSQLVQKASPLECALVRGSVGLVRLLYESGACDDKEVDSLCQRALLEDLSTEGQDEGMEKVVLYLQQLSATPRSLKSGCRLVISHSLGVGYHRDGRVQQLPLPDNLKSYIQFSELFDLSSQNFTQAKQLDIGLLSRYIFNVS